VSAPPLYLPGYFPPAEVVDPAALVRAQFFDVGGKAARELALEPGGDRLAITGYGALQTRVRFATIDRRTGQLTLQPSSIDFTRTWPDGWKGTALPHGAVFSNP